MEFQFLINYVLNSQTILEKSIRWHFNYFNDDVLPLLVSIYLIFFFPQQIYTEDNYSQLFSSTLDDGLVCFHESTELPVSSFVILFNYGFSLYAIKLQLQNNIAGEILELCYV